MKGDEIIGETTDARGIRVVLLARICRDKVLAEHVELASFEDAVLEAVTSAEHVEVDPVYTERRRYFAGGLGPSRWLLVVVSYEQAPARIISAFGHRKDPPTWDAST
ncbi:MAG TPA: hypothetical protein VES97_12275 [Solirubrobacteraceae bacterium]|nr:hypothetical protein [Solirubrobacteraceae bacterium]